MLWPIQVKENWNFNVVSKKWAQQNHTCETLYIMINMLSTQTNIYIFKDFNMRTKYKSTCNSYQDKIQAHMPIK